MALANVIGHPQAIRVLRRAVAQQRLPRAYLFVGPPNVGKFTTAVELAKLLNCLRPCAPGDAEALDGCDHCEPCQRIAAGTFADVLAVQPLVRLGAGAQAETTQFEGAVLTTEQIAQIIARANLRSAVGRYKVFIVARAETMNPEAANRLLKTLEEPPPQTLLILTTSNPWALLPTIVSRCQRVAFHPVPLAQLRAALRTRLPAADQAALDTVARLAAGRVGWALSMLATPAAWQVRSELLNLLASLPTQPLVAALALAEQLIALAEQWWLALNPGASAREVLSRSGDRVRRVALEGLLDLLGSVLRDLMLVAAGEPQLVLNLDAGWLLEALASSTTPAGAQRAATAVQQVQRHLRGNANLRLACELLLLQLMQVLRKGKATAG
jgi:DNA polymerase-3 subunit delta'